MLAVEPLSLETVDCSLRGGAADDAATSELAPDAVKGTPPEEYFCVLLDGADDEVGLPALVAAVEILLPVFPVEAAEFPVEAAERLSISPAIADFCPAPDDDAAAVPARELGLGADGATGGLKFGRDGELPVKPVEGEMELPALEEDEETPLPTFCAEAVEERLPIPIPEAGFEPAPDEVRDDVPALELWLGMGGVEGGQIGRAHV